MKIRVPSLETAQNIAKMIVGFTTVRVVKTVIHNNIDTDLSKSQKAQVWVGSAAIAMTVADKCEKYTDKYIKDLYELGREMKDSIDTNASPAINE